jgi:hypothetical protein
MASARASIAEVLGSGVPLTVSEAVAIARAALVFDLAQATSAGASSGRPLPDTIFVESDGSIVSRHGAPPAISDVAVLLRTLLPPGSPGVPGGLRYAIARALGEVDAPPFDSPEDFSIILSRFQTADGPALAHGLLTRIDAGENANSRRTADRRRPNGATVTNLRRALREADSQLYERQRSADAQVTKRPRTYKVVAIAASFAGAILLFMAGAATRDRIATPLPQPEAARAVPAAGDIELEAPPRKLPVKARVRAKKPRVVAVSSSAPAQSTPKSRGFFGRLHLQWLKKAFS